MNCSSCNGAGFAPMQNTWSKASSLNYTTWQPYPEFNPKSKENYDYALNTCNKSIAGPPITNGYSYSNPQPPKKKEAFMKPIVSTFQQSSTNYIKMNNTWDVQNSYSL